MFSQVYSGTVCGADGQIVLVEADVSNGFPSYTMVGYLASEVKEARERVLTALKNAGVPGVIGKIIVNLSPAGIRKEGTAFDLSIAAAMLASMAYVPEKSVADTLILGELSLDGTVRCITGVLPIVCEARKQGIYRCIVPTENVNEAALVKGMKVYGCKSLRQMIAWFKETEEPVSTAYQKRTQKSDIVYRDFAQVTGQPLMKEAIETAVAGRHHLLLTGAPGAGKSLAASCIPSILPEMTDEEQMEVTKLHSIAGLLNAGDGLVTQRPFRQPHHSISLYAMVGGGVVPKPGEISLAHKGVLFLDEFAEFNRKVIDALRQPLENRSIVVDRVQGKYVFPGDFMLVAAMNPCPCGYYPDHQKCRCTPKMIQKYMHQISGPILDRFDIGIEVRQSVKPLWELSPEAAGQGMPDKTSASMYQAVCHAGNIQRERFKNEMYDYNSQIPANDIPKYCHMSSDAQKLIQLGIKVDGISMRGYHKLLKTARTIADIDNSDTIKEVHAAKALCYRGLDHSYWTGEEQR